MRLFSTFVLLLSTMLLAAFALGCSSESASVKIGLLAPQTGPIAQYAPGFVDAANVAIAELNETHDGDFVFELIVMDSGCDGTQAATAAQSLIDAGVVAIVGAACSGATLGAIAVAASFAQGGTSYHCSLQLCGGAFCLAEPARWPWNPARDSASFASWNPPHPEQHRARRLAAGADLGGRTGLGFDQVPACLRTSGSASERQSLSACSVHLATGSQYFGVHE